ncbi:MutS-related protein [Singulisphaera sp. PoT]|uniref:MutS-related protein n=1 Tax=Singulisphaera sp. PoT TaxID=3411797 RepID=UPI003BF4D907
MAITEHHVNPVLADAKSEYQRRLALRLAKVNQLSRWERLITEARMGAFVLGLVLAFLIWGMGKVSATWIALPIGLFGVLVVVHERVRRRESNARRAADFYERGLARLDGEWAGKGVQGDRFLDLEHPYAADLDLFGRGSLFERICTARTASGEETLARWLLSPASADEILARQAAIAELRPKLDLREDLELLGGDVRAGLEPAVLEVWGREPRQFRGFTVPLAAGLISAFAILALAWWSLELINGRWIFLAILLEAAFARSQAGACLRVLANLEKRTNDLRLLSSLLQRLERETFTSPKLIQLRQALENNHEPASKVISKLARLLTILDAQRNQAFLPIAALLLWGIQCAVVIDAWRGRHGGSIGPWLAAVGEFEALAAFATYSYENAEDPFPTIEATGAVFEAEQVGHPLLTAQVCIRNDVRLDDAQRLLLVSGSNMSGKSTLLRSVGSNTVLALAGAPVRAKSLRVSLLSIGATLRIQDSLQAGKSRFYAEVTRLKQIVDLTRGPLPLLFLLDEILHGTNSHDRRVGAEGLLEGFLKRGAIGLVTTHDLALTDVVETIGDTATNVHFEDQFEEGIMHFDYRMRPGIVRKSNALALMRAVGLEV